MDLASNEQCQSPDTLKQLNADSRGTTSTDPVAPYDAKADANAVKLSESTFSPSFLSFFSFVLVGYKTYESLL